MNLISKRELRVVLIRTGVKQIKSKSPVHFPSIIFFQQNCYRVLMIFFAKNSRPEAEELAQLFADLKKINHSAFAQLESMGKVLKKGAQLVRMKNS